MIKDLSKFSFLLFLSLTLGLTSCDDDEDDDQMPAPSGPTQNIAEIASNTDRFSILVDALNATDLTGILTQNGPFTVFAPNNDAFNQYFDDQGITDANNDGSRVDDAAAELGADGVANLLLYHVLAGEVRAGDITAQIYSPTSSTASPNGNALTILVEPAGGSVNVNGGTGKGGSVVAADILATNGVIHEVNSVLELPNVVDHAIANSNFSTLTQLVVDAGLVGALSDENATLTVFAPLNSGFAEIQSTLDVLSPEQVSQTLQYHVTGNEVRAEQISVGPESTLQGENIVFSIGADDVTVNITDVNGGVVTVLITNVQGTNGVVHAIDKVLIPTL